MCVQGSGDMGEGLGMHIEPRLIACEILRFQPTDRFLECIGDEKARRVEHEPSGLRRRQAEVDTSPTASKKATIAANACAWSTVAKANASSQGRNVV